MWVGMDIFACLNPTCTKEDANWRGRGVWSDDALCEAVHLWRGCMASYRGKRSAESRPRRLRADPCLLISSLRLKEEGLVEREV
jgi:hypothetical protein